MDKFDITQTRAALNGAKLMGLRWQEVVDGQNRLIEYIGSDGHRPEHRPLRLAPSVAQAFAERFFLTGNRTIDGIPHTCQGDYIFAKEDLMAVKGASYAKESVYHLPDLPQGAAVQRDGALRYDSDKLPIHLLPVRPLKDVAAVLLYGARKYSPRNWEKGMQWSRCYDSMMRHSFAFWQGEDHDGESGCFHLAMTIVNAMFLLEYMRTHPELDDRPDPKEEGGEI